MTSLHSYFHEDICSILFNVALVNGFGLNGLPPLYHTSDPINDNSLKYGVIAQTQSHVSTLEQIVTKSQRKGTNREIGYYSCNPKCNASPRGHCTVYSSLCTVHNTQYTMNLSEDRPQCTLHITANTSWVDPTDQVTCSIGLRHSVYRVKNKFFFLMSFSFLQTAFVPVAFSPQAP